MIERFVMLKMSPQYATDDALDEIARYSIEVLAKLPGVVDARVGRPVDQATSEQWDLALVLRFSSADQLEPYRVHPDHRAYVDQYLRPRLRSIKAWSFVV